MTSSNKTSKKRSAAPKVEEEDNNNNKAIAMWTPQEPETTDPYDEQLQVVPLSQMVQERDKYFDVSKALQAKLGCSGIYWDETGYETSQCKIVKSKKAYQKNWYGSLSFRPQPGSVTVARRFLGKPINGHPLILGPIALLSGGHLPPYGRMDMIKTGNAEHDDMIPETDEDKSKTKTEVNIRPDAWSPWSNGQPYDLAMVMFCDKIVNFLEPVIYSKMIEADMQGEFQKMWNPESGDVTKLVVRTSASLFRKMTYSEVQKIDTLKVHTEELTDLCRKMFVMPEEFNWYRLTTDKERQGDASAKFVQKLTMAQITCIDTANDLVMIAYELKPLLNNRDKCKLQLQLHSLIWVGHNDAYTGITDRSLDEFLKYVPDFPTPPTDDELYQKHSKPVEEELREDLIKEQKRQKRS